MSGKQWRVFLNTNVLIAGLASRTGASAAILDLAEAEEIVAVLSQHVLVEADRVFLAKFPHLIGKFRLFIKNLAPLLLDDPKAQAVYEASKLIEPDDAPVLAAVKSGSLDYLVTLDIRHFKTAKVRDYLLTPVVTPGEFLMYFRTFWGRL